MYYSFPPSPLTLSAGARADRPKLKSGSPISDQSSGRGHEHGLGERVQQEDGRALRQLRRCEGCSGCGSRGLRRGTAENLSRSCPDEGFETLQATEHGGVDVEGILLEKLYLGEVMPGRHTPPRVADLTEGLSIIVEKTGTFTRVLGRE